MRGTARYTVCRSADAGVYSRVTITVGDGKTTAIPNPFDIQVRTKSGGPPVGANGAVTLGLTAPTENIDGAPLTDLAGYRIYWGTAPGKYSYSAKLDNPGVTTYLVERLSATTWYFVATAVNSQGVESEFSDVLAVTLSANGHLEHPDALAPGTSAGVQAERACKCYAFALGDGLACTALTSAARARLALNWCRIA